MLGPKKGLAPETISLTVAPRKIKNLPKMTKTEPNIDQESNKNQPNINLEPDPDFDLDFDHDCDYPDILGYPRIS